MERKHFLKLITLLPFLKTNAGLAQLLSSNTGLPTTARMPVFFVGHADFSKKPHVTPFNQNLRAMGATVKPAAILVISAHWLTLGNTYVNINQAYETPEYPSKGSPETGKMIMEKINAKGAEYRDLDHAAWSVLRHIAPEANVPVLELSIDMEKPLDYHYRIARELSSLRSKGVLIIGSGNIVHNLEMSALKVWSNKPYDWALDFDEWAKQRINERDFSSLFQYYRLGKIANYAVPTMDHYLPLLYCLSLCDKNEEIVYTHEEVIRGLSFRCFRIS